jgi:Na+/H+-dicarboxylate symporter
VLSGSGFVGAFAGGQLLQVLVISVLFGFALLALKPERRSVIEDGLSRVSECFFEFINLIMKFAPLGAFGSVAYAVNKSPPFRSPPLLPPIPPPFSFPEKTKNQHIVSQTLD